MLRRTHLQAAKSPSEVHLLSDRSHKDKVRSERNDEICGNDKQGFLNACFCTWIQWHSYTSDY